MQVNVGEHLVREQQGHRWPLLPTKLVHDLDSRLGHFIPRFHPGGVLEIHEAVFVGTPDLRLLGQAPDLLQRGEHIAQLPFKDRPAGAGKEGVTGEEVVAGREMVGDMGAGVGVDIEDHALALVDDDLLTWADNAGLQGNTAPITSTSGKCWTRARMPAVWSPWWWVQRICVSLAAWARSQASTGSASPGSTQKASLPPSFNEAKI